MRVLLPIAELHVESVVKVLNQVLNFNAKTILSFPALWVEAGVDRTEEVEEALNAVEGVGKTVEASKIVEVGNIFEVGMIVELGNTTGVGRIDNIEDCATLEENGEGSGVRASVLLDSDEESMVYDDMEEAMVWFVAGAETIGVKETDVDEASIEENDVEEIEVEEIGTIVDDAARFVEVEGID